MTNTSQKNNIFIIWLTWQFYEAPRFLLHTWKNYLTFASNYFSAPLLLKTFFSPWRRYQWDFPKNFDIGEFFSALVSNLFSIIIGMIMRTCLIIVGILLQLFVLITGAIIFILWLAMPFLAIAGFIFLFYF